MSIKTNVKYSAWVVKSQDWNLTELAGICSNGGTCGLMRYSTQNFTNIYIIFF